MRIKRFTLFIFRGLVFLIFAGVAAASAVNKIPPDANSIVVTGQRKEKHRNSSAGQRSVFRPSGPSRQKTDQHLEEESALQVAGTGQPRPSGFVVPRIRGQDARVSDVYVDYIRLTDPYSGLPFPEDIDVKAFDRLELYRGVSPLEVPVANPVGVIRYVWGDLPRPKYEVGGSFGRPYGTSAYGLAHYRNGNGGFARVYGRSFYTDGRYEFYDDNGTPFNSDDDKTSIREDNDSRSFQFLPNLGYAGASYRLSYFGLWNDASRGIPSVGGREKTGASVSTALRIHGIRYVKEFSSKGAILPKAWGTYVLHSSDKRRTNDPNGVVLITSRQHELSVTGKRSAVFVERDVANWAYKAEFEVADAVVESSTTRLERRATTSYLGARIGSLSGLSLQLKGHRKEVSDDAQEGKVDAEATGYNGVLAWKGRFGRAYSQFGSVERLASLVERFGDGASVLAASDLDQEMIRHLEVGASTSFASSKVEVGAAVFRDRYKDKIVFVPASIPNSVRAVNLGESEITGIETWLGWQFWLLNIDMSYTRMNSENRFDKQRKKIPLVPEESYAVKFSRQFKRLSVWESSRYRGDVYRDANNLIEVPGIWIHDFGFDVDHRGFGVGGLIDNFTDERSVQIRSPETGETGKTARSELNGYPLPGRTWQFFVRYKF